MIGCPICGPGSDGKGLPCLWAELMSFPRREAAKLYLVLKTNNKQKTEPFAVGEQEEERFLDTLDSFIYKMGVMAAIQ